MSERTRTPIPSDTAELDRRYCELLEEVRAGSGNELMLELDAIVGARMADYGRSRLGITLDDDAVAEFRSITAELETLEPSASALGERLYRALRQSPQFDRDVPDELTDAEIQWWRAKSGYEALFDAAMRVTAHLVYATDCVPGDNAAPAWFPRSEAI